MAYDDQGKDFLWRTLMSLIVLILFGAIFSLSTYFLRDHISEYLNRPKLTAEQLEENNRQRDISRQLARQENYDLVENGIHVHTGLAADENLSVIIGSCTSCHSAKLITQNKATREGWKSMIVWMQQTQGLQDLGVNEPIILDYLEEYYSPIEVSRRPNIDMDEVEWYILNVGDE